jgi:proteasome lid subunit RPN8/RPN11
MRIRRAVFEAIRAHARCDTPYECCGLLIGTPHEVLEAIATTNVAADPLRRYEVSPVEHLAQIRRCRDAAGQGAAGLGVVGVYHSHPRSSPEPSPTDWEQAFEDFLYVIAGPVEMDQPVEIRGYRLTAGRFAPAELIEI